MLPTQAQPAPVYVYDAAVRLWHWVTALCIFVLAPARATSSVRRRRRCRRRGVRPLPVRLHPPGALRGRPDPRRDVPAAHLSPVRGRPPRAADLLRCRSGAWPGGRKSGSRSSGTCSSSRGAKDYVGHNPLAHVAMFLVFVLPLILMLLTGFALYAEGQGIDSGWYKAFGWVFSVLRRVVVHRAHGASRRHVDDRAVLDDPHVHGHPRGLHAPPDHGQRDGERLAVLQVTARHAGAPARDAAGSW